MSDLNEHLNGLPIEERAALRWQLKKAAAARESLPAFFEYVVREEISQQPLKTLAHQRIFMRFTQQHQRAVLRLPVGFGKTFLTATDVMYGLGQDPLMRASIISSAEAQAAKPLSMVRSYITESPQLRLVFPKLIPTQRDGEPWTQTAITIDRPYGIRDPSVVAIGMESSRLTGSRLKRVYVDDILSKENCHTKDQREATKSYFRADVLSRRDIEDSRITVTNTPRDPDDLTYWLEKVLLWPTCTMDAYGDIRFSNTDFDCDDIRPAYEIAESTDADPCRLSAHDTAAYLAAALAGTPTAVPQPDNRDREGIVSLWPERWPIALLEERRTTENSDSPLEWNQTMRCIATSDESSKVKRAWVERCQQLARDLGYSKTVREWTRGNTFTGVDLAIGKGKQHDYTCFFTIFIDDEGRRIVLDVDYGRWSGTEILSRLTEKHERYGSIIRIETNAAQFWMKEFALEVDPGLPIHSHNTGKNKTDPKFGLEMVFTDIENGLWVIPTGDKGVDRWISEMYQYDPDKHTGDLLMAAWLAREQARKYGAFARVRARRNGIKGLNIGQVSAR